MSRSKAEIKDIIWHHIHSLGYIPEVTGVEVIAGLNSGADIFEVAVHRLGKNTQYIDIRMDEVDDVEKLKTRVTKELMHYESAAVKPVIKR